jgi:hypothetical protein
MPESIFDQENMIRAYCDNMNQEAGKVEMQWFQIQPEDDPDAFIALNPITRVLCGPNVRVGKRYHLTYSSPVRLPFLDKLNEGVAFHVKEITGTLNDIFHMHDVKLIVCQPDDYSITGNVESNISVFRFFDGDQIEELR